MMDALLAVAREAGPVALKLFFGFTELLLIRASIYIFPCRKKLFGYKEEEGHTYASTNLRMAMVILV